MNNKKILAPELRFKMPDSSLTIFKLDELVTFKSGGTPPKNNPLYWGGVIPWISAASMKGKYYSTSERTITEEGLNNGSKLAPKGSLLLLVRGSMLFNKIPIGITEVDVAFNQDLKALSTNENTTIDFLYQWFYSKENLLLDKVVGTGLGAGKLDTEDLKNLKVYLPSHPEQQKIASFLSTVDEKILQLTRKKELLEQYKKGVMQQLFSGKLRFKDENGKTFSKLKNEKLENVLIIKKGEQLNASELTETGLFPALNGGINPSGYTDNWNRGENVVTISEGGNSCGYVNLAKTKFWCGGHCYALIELHKTILNDYLFHFLKYNELKIMNLRVGSGLPNIQKKDLNKFKIDLPSVEEQKKIANYLSNIDNKIEIVNKQITQTQTFKKGLLQQMFV